MTWRSWHEEEQKVLSAIYPLASSETALGLVMFNQTQTSIASSCGNVLLVEFLVGSHLGLVKCVTALDREYSHVLLLI